MDLSLLQIVYKKCSDSRDGYKLRLVDFANISSMRVETRSSNYGTIVPPKCKKLQDEKTKTYINDQNVWYDVTISADGLRYQAAFVVLHTLSHYFGFDQYFNSVRHPYVYYEGPYDKHIQLLQNIVDRVRRTEFMYPRTTDMVSSCLNIFNDQIQEAQELRKAFL